MYSKLTKFFYGLLLGIAMITASQAEDFLALDEAIPINSNTAKYAPVFDFDDDGCYPSAGISREGQFNPGLSPTGPINGDCSSSNFLDTSNTLHRYACVTSGGSTYCGHIYALYFEKDQSTLTGCPDCGHVHDWEYVAVWTTGGIVTHVTVSQHSEVETRYAYNVLFEGDHPMIVYHKDDGGGGTHCFRFATTGDAANIQNPYDRFVTPPLASWNELTGDSLSNPRMRTYLNYFDYHDASIPLRDTDNTFLNNLNNRKPSNYPAFIEISDPPMEEDCYLTAEITDGSGAETCDLDYAVTGIVCYHDHCDNKRLMCCRIPGLNLKGPEIEIPWFSEEPPNNFYMSDAHAVVGMRCIGSFCDGIHLILRSAVGTRGKWTDSFSDPIHGDCGNGYVAGVACYSDWCGDLRLYCKGIVRYLSIIPLLLLDTK